MSGSQPEVSYYPPRAGRFSRLWYFWFRMKQVKVLQRLARPKVLDEEEQLLSLLLPGYIFVALGYEKIGFGILICYGITIPVTLAAIGAPEAEFGWGVLLSVHATSILQLLISRSHEEISVLKRIGLGFLVVVALALCVYMPAHNLITTYVAVPLQTNREFLVANPRWDSDEIRVGDVVVYHVEADSGTGYRIPEGVNYGNVLAAEGDRIAFFPDRFEINGVPYPPLKRMPPKGAIAVKAGFWFIWPEFTFTLPHGGTLDISTILQNNAIVSTESLIGKPYKRWFHRDQSHLFRESAQP